MTLHSQPAAKDHTAPLGQPCFPVCYSSFEIACSGHRHTPELPWGCQMISTALSKLGYEQVWCTPFSFNTNMLESILQYRLLCKMPNYQLPSCAGRNCAGQQPPCMDTDLASQNGSECLYYATFFLSKTFSPAVYFFTLSDSTSPGHHLLFTRSSPSLHEVITFSSQSEAWSHISLVLTHSGQAELWQVPRMGVKVPQGKPRWSRQ